VGKGTPRGIVYVVDDDTGMRTGVCRLLEASGYDARGYGSAGEFLLARLADAPGCLLLDLKLPGPGGLELQEALAKRGDSPPVVFLTGHGDVASSVRALKSGAADFLEKPVKREVLLAAVESALAQDVARRAARDERRVLEARYATLTPRERDVLAHVVAGQLNKQIASDIGVAERTVKAHRAQVMEKMQVGSLAELVRVAARLSLPQAQPEPNPGPETAKEA
jgi:FixJ family two-component response regulator